jgi:hypothetical protein
MFSAMVSALPDFWRFPLPQRCRPSANDRSSSCRTTSRKLFARARSRLVLLPREGVPTHRPCTNRRIFAAEPPPAHRCLSNLHPLAGSGVERRAVRHKKERIGKNLERCRLNVRETGLKIATVIESPTFGSPLSMSGTGAIVGTNTGNCGTDSCVIGFPLSLVAVTRRVLSSPSCITPRSVNGVRSQPRESRSREAEPAVNRASDLASSFRTLFPTGIAPRTKSTAMILSFVVSTVDDAAPTCVPDVRAGSNTCRETRA